MLDGKGWKNTSIRKSAGGGEENCRSKIAHGPLRLQDAIPEKEIRRKDEHQASCQKQARATGTKRLGVAHESKEGSLQPSLLQNDLGLLGLDRGDDCQPHCCGSVDGNELVKPKGPIRHQSPTSKLGVALRRTLGSLFVAVIGAVAPAVVVVVVQGKQVFHVPPAWINSVGITQVVLNLFE